jgi:xylulokinase
MSKPGRETNAGSAKTLSVEAGGSSVDRRSCRFFAGLDVSTQSCKLVVIDFDDARVVYADRVVYDDDLPHYATKDGVITGAPEGVSESDPNMWVEAVEVVLSRLVESPIPQEKILALSVSGQQHGLVAIDADGQLARPTSKLWNDFSTAEECEILTESVGGLSSMIKEVGNSQRSGYAAGKIFHMKRHEPDVYACTHTLFICKDFINWVLTGGQVGGVRATEPGDASGTALWNPTTEMWSDRLIRTIDPGLGNRLPDVVSSDRSIGRISRRLADRFGLSQECVVAPGSGDNMCAAIGTGNIREGIVTLSLGTSGTACTYQSKPFTDLTGEIAAFRGATGGYLPLLCVSNLANGYNEALRLHGLTHETFIQLVETIPPGNEGRILVPWYAGERTPDVPNASPVHFGFELGSLEPGILCRALLEGHVLNLHAGFGGMPITSNEITEIRLTGGLSQSSVWCQTIADVFEAEVVPVTGEAAALGAALHAAWVWLGEANLGMSIEDVVEPFVKFDESLRKVPRAGHREAVRVQKRLFAAIVGRLRGLAVPDPFELRTEMLALLEGEQVR